MSNVPPGFPPGFPFPPAPAPAAQYQQTQYAPTGPQYPPQAQYQQPPAYSGGNVVDDIISAMLGAESSEGGNGFTHGRYLCLIEAIVFKKGNEGPLFIPEFYIEQSQSVNMMDSKTGQLAVALPAGSSAGFPCKMNKKAAASNARGFVLALLEKTENKSDPALTQLIGQKMSQWAQPGQPLRGFAVSIETFDHEIQSGENKGKHMVRLRFRRVPGQTAASVAANRAKLDAVAAGQSQMAAQAVAAQPAPAPTYSANPQLPAAPMVGIMAPAPQAPAAPAPATDPFAGIL